MPRILIVDDEPAIVQGLEDNLRFEGYETLAATSGEEGLARALGEAPDLVLLDVMMPTRSAAGTSAGSCAGAGWTCRSSC